MLQETTVIFVWSNDEIDKTTDKSVLSIFHITLAPGREQRPGKILNIPLAGGCLLPDPPILNE